MKRTLPTAESIAVGLERSQRSGSGWMACCPAHEDKTPSLSITDREDGGVLIHCHAGCEQTAVINALRERRLWDRDSVSSPYRNGNGESETIYPYRYQSGALAFEVVRRDGPDGKTIRPRLPDGTWKAHPKPRPLYRLPELLSRPTRPVLVVEGEKTAHSASTLFPEWCVTTSSGGSKAAAASDWKPLQSRRVTIWPDADPPGAQYAEDVARLCHGIGAADVRIVALPETLPKGWDLADAIPPGMDVGALLAATKAPTVTGGLGLVPLGDVLDAPDEEVAWLVDDMLPTGGFSMMVAKPKAGKSTLARCLVVAVAQGRPWLGKTVTQGTVFYLALEEKRAEVKRHFHMMGAQKSDPIHVFIDQAPRDALKRLEIEVSEKKPALVIIDPLFRFTRIIDGNDYAQITAALDPLLRLARKNGTHVLVTHHSKKGGGMDGDEVLGSTALYGTVDCLISLKRFPVYRTAYTQQRYGSDMEETIIALDSDTGWVDVKGTRTEADEQAVGKAILEFLETQTQPVTEPKITENIGGATRLVRSALRALVSSQKIHRTGGGKRGDPYTYACFLVPST